MALATIAELRTLGGLPDAGKLPDAKLSTQLTAAGRELTRWIGPYADATSDYLADCKEAECCIAMSYLVPILNTFFTSGITTLQKEIGDMEFQFHNPDQIKAVSDAWLSRAKRVVSAYQSVDAGTAPIGWNAI